MFELSPKDEVVSLQGPSGAAKEEQGQVRLGPPSTRRFRERAATGVQCFCVFEAELSVLSFSFSNKLFFFFLQIHSNQFDDAFLAF